MKKYLKAAKEHLLTERQRQVLELFLEGKNGVEIADILGVNNSTISRTLSRAIEKIERNKIIFDKVVR